MHEVYTEVLIYTPESTGASMERTEMPNLRNGSKVGFEPRLTWLRVRHSTTELLLSTLYKNYLLFFLQKQLRSSNTCRLSPAHNIEGPGFQTVVGRFCFTGAKHGQCQREMKSEQQIWGWSYRQWVWAYWNIGKIRSWRKQRWNRLR